MLHQLIEYTTKKTIIFISGYRLVSCNAIMNYEIFRKQIKSAVRNIKKQVLDRDPMLR
ncbi:hypothetical protein [Candidatus Symbiopectobacterium sp.]|uniref:hypothetical protein n=1 Tax=Candidatus Symbiopectobacterium sp. TaxID=2816440 RepID=UPI0025C5AF68|nr:hypothetical protein [Candidatus Symbiopectobacterium sp.]